MLLIKLIKGNKLHDLAKMEHLSSFQSLHITQYHLIIMRLYLLQILQISFLQRSIY